MKILGWAVGLAACIVTAAWFAFAWTTERVVTGWLEARAADGWVVNYTALETVGFPTEFETVFEGLELADPATGWAWRAPDFTLTQAALRPDRIRADWPERQSLASPFERLEIEAAELRADLDVQPTNRFAIDAAHTVMRDVRVLSDTGAAMELARGDLRMTRVAGEASTYDVLFEAEGLRLPPEAARRLDPAGLLPDAIEGARYEARMTFDAPWDLGAIEAARPQITALTLTEMRAQWGALLFRATGDLTVDAAGRVSGALSLRAENWRMMLDMGVRAGALSPAIRGAAERALGFVAGLSGRAEDIDATLRFDEGFMFFGPLPLGEAPRLVLR